MKRLTFIKKRLFQMGPSPDKRRILKIKALRAEASKLDHQHDDYKDYMHAPFLEKLHNISYRSKNKYYYNPRTLRFPGCFGRHRLATEVVSEHLWMLLKTNFKQTVRKLLLSRESLLRVFPDLRSSFPIYPHHTKTMFKYHSCYKRIACDGL